MFFTLSKIAWLAFEPSMFIALLLTGGVGLSLLNRPRWRRLGLRLSLTGAALLLIAGLSPLGNMMTERLEDRFPRAVVTASSPPITGIVILGGALSPELSAKRGEFSLNGAAERLTEGVLLARRHPSAKVLFAGGFGQLGTGADEAATAGEFMQQLGISTARILLERRSRNTYENAVFARQIADFKPGERWLLVTSATHMPRAMGCFRKTGFTVEPWPVDYRTSGPADAYRLSDGIAEGLRRFDIAAKEFAGLLVYRLRGRTDALWPGP